MGWVPRLSPPPDSDLLPNPRPLGSTSVAATWSVAHEAQKHGAGILFFAYGSKQRTLRHFLEEADASARSFRTVRSANRPRLQIAVVSNNETVDPTVFDVHIKPRPDLLFAGDPCNYGPKGCKPNQRPRQWATRLYYLAQSPFEITWALDSNTVCCDISSAVKFLHAAEMSGLWGFDIATANQAAGHGLYPHNWNLMIRWSRASSNLMRDWLLMQFRRGLAADDQGTLYAAMQRQRAAGGLRVGQMPTPFAAAFYSATQSFYPRLTRPLTRSAVVLHIAAAKSDAAAEACRAFNAEIGTRRQLWIHSKGASMAPLHNMSQCKKALKKARCAYGDQAARVKGHEAVEEEKVFQPALRDPQQLSIKF